MVLRPYTADIPLNNPDWFSFAVNHPLCVQMHATILIAAPPEYRDSSTLIKNNPPEHSTPDSGSCSNERSRNLHQSSQWPDAKLPKPNYELAAQQTRAAPTLATTKCTFDNLQEKNRPAKRKYCGTHKDQSRTVRQMPTHGHSSSNNLSRHGHSGSNNLSRTAQSKQKRKNGKKRKWQKHEYWTSFLLLENSM